MDSNHKYQSLYRVKRASQVFLIFITSIISFQMFQPAFGFGNMETKLIYYPMRKEYSPIRLELKNKLQDTFYYSSDGVKLNAWYIKSQDNKPTVIYCHGQGENITLWQDVYQFLANKGYGVFVIDYRGHGRSEGSPFETGLYTDLESAIKYLKDYEHIPQDKIVLWGRSLGGAVVADIAARDKFKGVILESTFTNIREVALHLCETGIIEGKSGFWEGMATKFVKYMPFTQKFDTEDKIGMISSPLLIGASLNDRTVPPEMSRELASMNPKAELYLSSRGSHHESDWFENRVLSFLESLN